MRVNYFELPTLAAERPRLNAAVAEFRRRMILSALSRNHGNAVHAARELGIGYSTLKAHLAKERAA